ncbi:MAG: hypothetical protein AAB425_04070 [Bdellovibrionota bacterium]
MALSLCAPASLARAESNEAEADGRLRPRWAADGLYSNSSPNQSYLADTGRCAHPDRMDALCATYRRIEFLDRFLETPVTGGTKGAAMGRIAAIENKSSWVKYDPVYSERDAILSWQTDMERMTIDTIEGMGYYYTSEGVTKAEQRVEAVRTFTRIQTDAVAGLQNSVAIGPSAPNAAPEQKFEIKYGVVTDIKNHRTSFTTTSPIVNGNFDFDFGIPADVDLGLPKERPNLEGRFHVGGERFAVGLSRGIPLLNIQSGLSYGGSSQTLNASLTKWLTTEVACIAETTKAVDWTAKTLTGFEERIRFVYTINF